MARFTPGPLVGTISGSIHSLTFVQSRNGPIVRARPSGTSKKSEAKIRIQRQHQMLTQAWSTLPEAWRKQWNETARQLRIAYRTGPYANVNGFQLYLKYLAQGNITLSSGYFPPPPAQVAPPPAFAVAYFAEEYAYLVQIVLGAGTSSGIFTIYGARTFKTTMGHTPPFMPYLTKAPYSSFPVDLYSPWAARLGPMKEDEVFWLKIVPRDTLTFPGAALTISGAVFPHP